MDIFDKYCCPKCGEKTVKRSDAELFCSKCSIIFRIRNGILDFLDEKETRGWKASEEQFKLIALSDKIGWIDAVKNVYGNTDFSHWIMDYSRGNGCLVTSVNSDSIVLDAGCGLGAISIFLSKICKEVHSFDSLFEYLVFLKIRAAQDKVDNIFPARGDLMHLPYEKNYFDLIICNGVLEHLPIYYTEDSPTNIQIKVLRKFNEILRPGGELYLGIENRFGLKYCFGARDEHTGLRFITVLPRWIANLYSKHARKREYRPYTYSLKQLEELFQKANFKLKKVYMPVKSYRDVKFIIDLQEPQSFAFALKLMEKKFVGSKDIVFKKIAKLATIFRLHHIYLHKFFSHSFSIIAEKQVIS